ncbi:MAG: hypothetical protein EPO28_17500 [Saprospiraceae bacterium]|nr:MAG: hypothetical protein EPO28_17500 [Saprospiraceae bacterium]
MPFIEDILKVFTPEQKPLFKPRIRGWNRLEGNPRKSDFSRSLRAEIRDPLWLLARQWQFGEFQGEDAGSPINVDVLAKSYRLNRYAIDQAAATAYSDEIPLEAHVEREPVPGDLGTQITLARFLLKHLKRALPAVDFAAAKDWLRQEYAVAINVDTMLHRESEQMHALALQMLFDGYEVVQDMRAGAFDGKVDASPLSAMAIAEVKSGGQELTEYFKALFTQPANPADDAWKPSYLEYQFTAAAEDSSAKKTLLYAEQYAQGHLDWYSFDIDNQPNTTLTDKQGEAIPSANEVTTQLSFLPAPVSFGGMPLPRYWEMENYKTEFADVTANTTDVAKLLLTEFALIYSNDWAIVPFNLEVGTMTDVLGIVVTDVFGERLLIHPAGQGTDEAWQRWTLFNLHTTAEGDMSDHRLFLPPAVDKLLESDPIEKVNFLRDEMANMVWAVESTLPSALGTGISGHETAARLREEEHPVPPVFHDTEAKIRYVLGTEVPYNWIPFVPVHNPGSNRQIRLQRAKMPGGKRYKGEVLDHSAPFYVHEEEVPRSGALVCRSYQRTRWYGGKTFVWIGKRKLTGKGEGSSGLQFDQVKEVK